MDNSAEKDFLKYRVDCLICFVCQRFRGYLKVNSSITGLEDPPLLFPLCNCSKKLLDFFGLNIYICSLLKIEPWLKIGLMIEQVLIWNRFLEMTNERKKQLTQIKRNERLQNYRSC